MQAYKDFRPTGFDSHLDINPDYTNGEDVSEWLVVPCGRNRDLLEESNFWSALKMLGGQGNDVQIHRFGHWACGWFELILVRPDSEEGHHGTVCGISRAAIALSIESYLADYPILDETDLSQREMAEVNRV